MALLILLLVVFLAVLAALRLLKKPMDWSLAGRIAMAVMLIFTGTGHFFYTEGMIMMLPPFVP
ncbi:MAG: hypothetical protein WKF97_07600 [Chitinophagaceae bacterium]